MNCKTMIAEYLAPLPRCRATLAEICDAVDDSGATVITLMTRYFKGWRRSNNGRWPQDHVYERA